MQSGLSTGISFNGSQANGLVTYGNSTTANVEPNLIYDSSVYHMQLRSQAQGFPKFDLVTDTENAIAGQFRLVLESQSLANLDDLGTIGFYGGTDYSSLGGGGTGTNFAYMKGVALDVTSGSEAGRFDIRVRTNGSIAHNGIRLDGSNSSNIINTTIGAGTTSLTTIAGDLQVNGNDIKDDDGTTCITFDSSGNTTIQNDLTVGAQEDGDATLIISADTDNGSGEEGDNARLWFKQDGDITEGAIQMSSNKLNIINNISGAGGISFQTGATNNTGTTDPATGATERMSIASGGTVTVAGHLSTNSLFSTSYINGDSVEAFRTTSVIRESEIPTSATAFSGLSEIISGGTVYGGGNLTAGKVYQLTADTSNNANMSWKATDAGATASSSGLLAVALGTNPSNGMLLRGVVVIADNLLGNYNPGTTLFLRAVSGGMTNSAPTGSGDCQRIVGHFLKTTAGDGDRMIHFNPSQEFITIA